MAIEVPVIFISEESGVVQATNRLAGALEQTGRRVSMAAGRGPIEEEQQGKGKGNLLEQININRSPKMKGLVDYGNMIETRGNLRKSLGMPGYRGPSSMRRAAAEAGRTGLTRSGYTEDRSSFNRPGLQSTSSPLNLQGSGFEVSNIAEPNIGRGKSLDSAMIDFMSLQHLQAAVDHVTYKPEGTW